MCSSILGNTSQVGRFWIRQLTPVVYTATAQTGSYEQTTYLHVQPQSLFR